MSTDPSRQLSDAQIEAMMERAAYAGFKKGCLNLGINIESPADLRAWHADLQFIRTAREGSARLSVAAKTSAIGTVITAVIGILIAVWNSGGAGGAP